MRFQHYFLHVISFMSVICFSRAKKLCDARIWYLNIIGDDVFNLDLTPDQLSLKKSIESLVLKASGSKETRMVECSVLYMYNDMLQDIFDYTPSGSGMTLTEVESAEPAGSVEDVDPELKYDGMEEDMVSEEKENKNQRGQERDEEGISDYTDSILTTEEAPHSITENQQIIKAHNWKEIEPKERMHESEQIAPASDEKEQEYIANSETNQDYLAAQDDRYLIDKGIETFDSHENVYSDGIDQVQSEMQLQEDESNNYLTENFHVHKENDADSIDETEVDEIDWSTDPLEEASVLKESDPSISSDSNSNSGTEHEKEHRDETVSNKIPFGVCWAFGCLKSDIFDVYGRKASDLNMSDYEQLLMLSNGDKSQSERKHIVNCPLGPLCTSKCFYLYLFSNSFCMKDFAFAEASVTFQDDEKKKTDMQKQLLNEDFYTNSQVNTDVDIETKAGSETDNEKNARSKTDSGTSARSETDTERNARSETDSETDAWSVTDTEANTWSKTDIDKKSISGTVTDTNTKSETDTDTKVRSETDIDTIKTSETDTETNSWSEKNSLDHSPENRLPDDLVSDKHNHFQQHEMNLKAEKMLTRNEKQSKLVSEKEKLDLFTPFMDKSQWTVSEFENIVEEKTSKYFTKLQTFEVMIMKLENQLLMEALNKQNHSSTITKLENQILRLENELLKMNKNYQTLREESLSISRRQNKYLELAYKKARSEYPKLPDHSGVKYELISQHQEKINELTEVLRNQSGIIMQMKEKYDTLEDQNKMFQQMVLNQSLLMASIMKNVQELTAQNIRNQEEINSLKQKLDRSVGVQSYRRDTRTENDVIDQLESLLFDRKIWKDRPDHIAKEDTENDKNNKYNTNDNDVMQKYPNNIIAKWCPKYNDTCPSCHYSSIINLQCAPFQRIIWATRVMEKVVIEGDFPSVPFVKDEKKTDLIEKELAKRETKDELGTGALHYKAMQETVGEIPQHEKSEIYDSDVIDNNDDFEGSFGNEELSKYTIVGYDKDGKPVLKIRDDGTKEQISETKEKLAKILTDENDINEKHTEAKDDLTERGNIIMKPFKEINDNNVKDIKESYKTVEKQSTVSRGKAETKNLNSDHEKKQSVAEKNVGSSQDEKTQAKYDIQINTDDAYIKKQNKPGESSAEPKDNSPYKKAANNAISDTKKENMSEKDVKLGVKTQKADSVQTKQGSETKSGLNKSSDKENLSSASSQQQLSGKIAKIENVPTEKHKDRNIEKKAERMVPVNLNKYKQTEPKDCYDHYNRGERKDGLFKVKPMGLEKVIEVFCDMRRGGWTVIQRRQDGTTNFYKEWAEYKKGFGGLYGEHWLGNDNIHLLTNQDYYKLRVDLMDWDKNKRYAEFDFFLIENEDEAYRIHVDGYSGDAGDGLTKHNGSKFSTKDVDNDKVVKEFGGSCAKRFYGAGWYYKCYASNLNGKFYKGGKIPEKKYDGITWKPWTGPNYSLKKVEMKIRPSSADSS